LSGWIARFRVPAEIKHDQGTQFESSLFKEVTKIFGLKQATPQLITRNQMEQLNVGIDL
jgi:hypothetical protein